MNLTVEEALSIYPLSKAKLVAGAGGTSRIIKSVNTMDAPDVSNWIHSGELLLTTAYAIKDTPADFLHLLKNLDQRGSAGIGIKLGRYWSEIPQIVIEEANRLHFPVLELPYEFAFSEQMRALFHAEFERSTKKLHSVMEKQKQLVRFALQTVDFSHLFPTIARILDHSIVIISSRGQILYNSCDWPEALLLKSWPWAVKFIKARTDQGWFFRIPLIKDNECYGFLLVTPKPGQTLPDEEGLFHQAAEILCYHMVHYQEDHLSVSSYQWGMIIERYLKRHISKETFIEQARAIGSPMLSSPHLCVLTVPLEDFSSEQSLHKKLQELRREIKYHPRLHLLETHHLLIEEGLLYIIKVDEAATKQEVFIDLILKSFTEILKSTGNTQMRSYVSNIKPELTAIAEAYEECSEARRISNKLHFDTPVVLFSDIELTYMFTHIPNEIMEKYCNSLLQPLMDKDPEYACTMLKTLEAYFSNEGMINNAAKQLFIHRNTVQYRLEKVSELLGLDFRKVGDLLKLKLVFTFKHLLATEKKANFITAPDQ